MTNMAKVELFMRPFCGFCAEAERILEKEGVSVETYDIWNMPGAAENMAKRTNNARTVPQIFINDQLIGGCDDLIDLKESGKLAPLLAS